MRASFFFILDISMAYLTSLPHELVLHIAESELLDNNSLCSLLRSNKQLYGLLWEVLYKRDKQHLTGFIRCITKGPITAVAKFLEVRVDVNAKIDLHPRSDFARQFLTFPFVYPLVTAVMMGHKVIVNLLLAQGAHVEAKIERSVFWVVHPDYPWDGASRHTALSVAVVLGHDDIAIELTKAMKDPDSTVCTRYGAGYTALELTALCLRLEVVNYLLLRGANPNKQHYSSNMAVLHVLLEDIDLPGYISRLPDEEELLLGVIMLLLQRGADPFLKRRCREHPSNPERSEECTPACNLTACSMGIRSRYPRVRQHFSELGPVLRA